MNYGLVSGLLGTMALFTGLTMGAPLLTAVFLGEAKEKAIFLTALFITLIVAYELRRKSLEGNLSVRDGIAVTGLGWIMVSLLGMMPYLLSGFFTPLSAFVESVSGFSGTGATVLSDVEALPRSLLLWRSFTNWIGGLGIVVIFMAILPQMGKGALNMFRAESGDKGRQMPRVRDHAKALFTIYITFTTLCALSFFLAGMEPFAAINYALSTMGTGGFAIHNDGLLVYDNIFLETAVIFFMILASGSFAMYFAAWQKGPSAILRDTEFTVFLSVLIVSSALIVADIVMEMHLSFSDALRRATFHVASIASTTAFVTDDFDAWPAFSKVILLLLMFMGGCAGSTSGGMKVSRVILLVKMIHYTVMQKLHPQILGGVRMNGKIIPDEALFAAARFFFAYLLVDIAFAMVMIIDGVDMEEAVSVAVSTLGSVGPGFGLAGAMSTYELLPPLSKLGACAVMFLGRLEIFTVVALFTPEFWNRRRGW